MHILMLNFEFPPLGGGAATATYNLLKALASDNSLTIDLITSGVGARTVICPFADNIRIVKIGIRKKEIHFWRTMELFCWMLKAYACAWRLIPSRSYDLCHCWFGWPSGLIGYLLRRRFPYLVALRGSDVPGYSDRLKLLDRLIFRRLSSLVWRNAHAVSVLSRNLEQMALQTLPGARFHVIYNGVDSDRFRPRPPSTVPPATLEMLFVGRLVRRKGVIHLLEAFRRLRDRQAPCRLTIAGSGPEQERLEAFCRASGITDRVNFLGSVPACEIAEIYRQAHVLVLPSIEEALSNVALEAMAAGLPVISTPTGAAELICGNGFVVPRRDPGRIEEAIRCYLEDEPLRQNHARQSRRIAERMTWHSTARAYRSLYRLGPGLQCLPGEAECPSPF